MPPLCQVPIENLRTIRRMLIPSATHARKIPHTLGKVPIGYKIRGLVLHPSQEGVS